MPINERGEVIREGVVPNREKSPEEKILDIYSGIRIQNNHPRFTVQPPDVFYWKGQRLEDVRKGVEELATLARQYGVSEIVNPLNPGERVNVEEFIIKVRKSVKYSENIVAPERIQPEESEEEKAAKRAAIRRRLLGED